MKNHKYLPFITKIKCTYVNDIMVWNSNKFINFLLKIKFLFTENPIYNISNKKVNNKYYQEIICQED